MKPTMSLSYLLMAAVASVGIGILAVGTARAHCDKKVGLMAGVVTQMVEQRIAMNARKAKMEEEMMQHMMQHMQKGKESMAQCPMMKGMKSMDEESAGDHKEH